MLFAGVEVVVVVVVVARIVVAVAVGEVCASYLVYPSLVCD